MKDNLFVADNYYHFQLGKLINVTVWTLFTIPLLFVLAMESALSSPSSSLNILLPGGTPYGLKYEDHVKSFWKWILAIPKEENPVADQSGKMCSNDQKTSNTSVFYLAFNSGGISERVCEVPAGKGLFIPVMQVEWSELESDPGTSIEELDQRAKNEQDNIQSLSLTIDNRRYVMDELEKYRVHTSPFEIVFANPPIFAPRESGPSQTVADGYYVITEPLAPGNYTVHFKSSVPGFAQDIKYTIVAQ